MSNTERDTHFAGFAEALLQELQPDLTVLFLALSQKRERDIAQAERIIALMLARRAYDLVQHTLLHVEHINLDRLSTDEHVTRIPDMPALLEVGKHE